MTTSIKKPVFIAKSGQALLVTPGTENPVSVDEMRRRRDEFYARYKHLLAGYGVEDFLREKQKDIEEGIE